MKNLKWTIDEIERIQIVEMEDNEFFATFIPEEKPEKILEIEWLSPYFIPR